MTAPTSDTLTHVELIWFEKRIEQLTVRPRAEKEAV